MAKPIVAVDTKEELVPCGLVAEGCISKSMESEDKKGLDSKLEESSVVPENDKVNNTDDQEKEVVVVDKKKKKKPDKKNKGSDSDDFKGDGLSFRGKLIGVEEVGERRGNDLCHTSMGKLKADVIMSRQHKKRITVTLKWDSVIISEEGTQVQLFDLPLTRISFVWKDPLDRRALGIICSDVQRDATPTNEDNTKPIYLLTAIKTEKSSLFLIHSLKTLFTLKEQGDENENGNKQPTQENIESEKNEVLPDLVNFDDSEIKIDNLTDTTTKIDSGMDDLFSLMGPDTPISKPQDHFTDTLFSLPNSPEPTNCKPIFDVDTDPFSMGVSKSDTFISTSNEIINLNQTNDANTTKKPLLQTDFNNPLPSAVSSNPFNTSSQMIASQNPSPLLQGLIQTSNRLPVPSNMLGSLPQREQPYLNSSWPASSQYGGPSFANQFRPGIPNQFTAPMQQQWNFQGPLSSQSNITNFTPPPNILPPGRQDFNPFGGHSFPSAIPPSIQHETAPVLDCGQGSSVRQAFASDKMFDDLVANTGLSGSGRKFSDKRDFLTEDKRVVKPSLAEMAIQKQKEGVLSEQDFNLLEGVNMSSGLNFGASNFN